MECRVTVCLWDRGWSAAVSKIFRPMPIFRPGHTPHLSYLDESLWAGERTVIATVNTKCESATVETQNNRKIDRKKKDEAKKQKKIACLFLGRRMKDDGRWTKLCDSFHLITCVGSLKMEEWQWTNHRFGILLVLSPTLGWLQKPS